MACVQVSVVPYPQARGSASSPAVAAVYVRHDYSERTLPRRESACMYVRIYVRTSARVCMYVITAPPCSSVYVHVRMSSLKRACGGWLKECCHVMFVCSRNQCRSIRRGRRAVDTAAIKTVVDGKAATPRSVGTVSETGTTDCKAQAHVCPRSRVVCMDLCMLPKRAQGQVWVCAFCAFVPRDSGAREMGP